MKRRSLFPVAGALCVALLLTACGKNYYFAGRNLPPSGVLNRVMVAIQNPSPLTKGGLQFDDALYDVRHSFDNKVPLLSIGGFAGQLPVTIQNMPEQQLGAVYSIGDGSIALVDYSQEKVSNTIASSSLNGISQSAFLSHDGNYAYAASQAAHSLTVLDHGAPVTLNLPGVYRVSVNPGNTIALAFIQNSNEVYSVVHLTDAQRTEAAQNPIGYVPSNVPGAQPSVDCEPQTLPSYCVFPVATGSASFDRPIKALFSPDGSTAYVLNCGPECGGGNAGYTTIPITGGSLNPGGIGAAGVALVAQNTVGVAGGATNGVFDGNGNLYLAGQQLQQDGLFAGMLSVVSLGNNQITGTYSISDGTHNKMILADDNTLWIGSYQCQSGERYKQSQQSATSNTQFGCMTMFNTATKAVSVQSFKGDGTGIAAVTGLHKVYTTEGGQVYIYNTPDGTARDNFNVTVTGTAYDVAYMDGVSDNNNTTY